MNTDGLSILYVGKMDGTSLDRANALRRLGHVVEQIDLRKLLPKAGLVSWLTHHLGGGLWSPWILRGLPTVVKPLPYDFCYVDGGELVTPRVIDLLRRYSGKVINYSIDDPLGPRDGAKSKSYRRSVPYYDLCVVMRSFNVAEAKSLGAKNVMRVFMSSDEVVHAPRLLTEQDRERWNAEVLFLGTWFPERGPFLLELMKRGVPLTIRGARWHKAPEWPELKSVWKGGPVTGDDYAKAIQCSRVNLGLLSKGNRDLHTTRSLEIPALGGLFCGERTAEHVELYVENQEALFWSTAEECAEVCLNVLANEPLRRQIAAAGRARSLTNGHTNENVVRSIVKRASALP